MAASELPTPPRPLPPHPTHIGRYEVVGRLGQGGMAQVFLAFQRGAFDAAKLVVVKQLRPEYVADQDFLAMFVDEARLALRFNHANVVHTFEVLAEAPDFCLVMEYLEGQTLAQLLRAISRQAFPLDEHVWILSQVLAGLGYAHSLQDYDGSPLGIVHRDVSPSNILVTSVGEVKLLDFGIAKAAGATSFTRQGIVKGKLGYAAPEQCMGEASDARSDLFAVGVMLWEAIARRRRSQGETEGAALRARLDGAEPAIETVVPDVAPELAIACRYALAQRPEERFASAAEFQACLERYLSTRPSFAPAESVSRLLREHFAPQINSVRQAIEAHASSSVRLLARSVTETGVRMASVAPSVTTNHGQADRTDPSVQVSFAPAGRKAFFWMGGGVAALSIVALLVSITGRGGSSNANPGSLGPRSVPSGSVPTATVAQPQIRHVLISVGPASAKLRLDGQRIDNPYVAELPVDDLEHELVATADGYEQLVRRFHGGGDVELRLSLTTEASTQRKSPKGGPVRARDLRSPPSAAPLVAEPTSPRSTPTSDEIKPGADLTRRTAAPRTTRDIDDKDPYSK